MSLLQIYTSGGYGGPTRSRSYSGGPGGGMYGAGGASSRPMAWSGGGSTQVIQVQHYFRKLSF